MSELENLVDETVKQLGRVDILVNNAGTTPVFGPVQDIGVKAKPASVAADVFKKIRRVTIWRCLWKFPLILQPF